MALVNNHQVEKFPAELPVNVLLLLVAADGLVERDINLVTRVHIAVADLGHHRAKRLEVVGDGLVREDIAVHEEQHPLDLPGLPQPPYNLKDGERLAGAGGHDHQHSALPPRNGFDRPLNGNPLIVPKLLVG